MATFSQKDIQLLFVGAAATATTGAIDAMNDGEIGIFTPAGARVTEATAATVEKFIIVKKTPNGGVPLVSSVIDKATMTDVTRKLYVASTEQVTNIGYNGTDGAIEAINDNDYHIRMSLRQEYVSNHGGLYLKHAFYASDLSATQSEIGSELLKSVNNNFSKEPDTTLTATLLCNHAGAAIGAAADTVVGNLGSKAVVITDTGADSSVIATSPGDYLRVGTATTSNVYKIVTGTAITGGTMILDTPLVAALNLVGTTAEYITAAQAATADFGLVLTGIAQSHTVGKLHNDLMPQVFDVSLENFGTTGNVLTTAAAPGNGTQKQIQELEWFCQGNEGDFHRIGEPNLFPSRAEATGNYDMITIQIQELYKGSITVGPINKNYTLVLPEGATINYAVDGTADDITDVLEVLYLGAVDGSLAVV